MITMINLCFNVFQAITWDPARLSANGLLSNGNLTFTGNNSVLGIEQGCCATVAVNSTSANPKWYYEIIWNTGATNPSIYYGYANSNASLNLWTGRDGVNSWGFEPGRNYTWYNGTPVARGGGPFPPPLTLCVAYDAVAGKIWYGKISSGVTSWVGGGDPSTNTTPSQTGLTGSLYPAVSVYGDTIGTNVTANFGATPFVGTVPTGFVSPESGRNTSLATLDPSAKGTTLTLSNGNLTYTAANVSTRGVVRSTTSHTAGQGGIYSVEILHGGGLANSWNQPCCVIPSTTTLSLNAAPEQQTNVCIYYEDGRIFKGGILAQTTGVTYFTGDRINIVMDCKLNTIQYYKNGVAVGTPIAVTGTWYILGGTFGYTSAATYTFNLSDMVYPIPGTTSW